MRTTKKFLDEDFDMKFDWYTEDEILRLAYSDEELAKLDQGDQRNLIHELGSRLEQLSYILRTLDK